MTVDVLATYPWYAAHIEPIAARVPATREPVALVAGYPDLVRARRAGYRRIVMAQHGSGQSYSSRHPHYAGGDDHADVGLFLSPNEHAAARWRAAYPAAYSVAVGEPRLDTMAGRRGPAGAVVAVAFHWDLYLCPETRSALGWFADALPQLAERFTVVGTGHPRRRDLARVYGRAGIEYVADFDEVSRRADVLVFDNTSVGYEFAATGRPVVVLDPPWYRPSVAHGLRFWDAANVGIRVADPAALPEAVERALAGDTAGREQALSIAYAYRHGAAQRAADTITAWLA